VGFAYSSSVHVSYLSYTYLQLSQQFSLCNLVLPYTFLQFSTQFCLCLLVFFYFSTFVPPIPSVSLSSLLSCFSSPSSKPIYFFIFSRKNCFPQHCHHILSPYIVTIYCHHILSPYIVTIYCSRDKIQEDEMGGACGMYGGIEKCLLDFDGKT